MCHEYARNGILVYAAVPEDREDRGRLKGFRILPSGLWVAVDTRLLPDGNESAVVVVGFDLSAVLSRPEEHERLKKQLDSFAEVALQVLQWNLLGLVAKRAYVLGDVAPGADSRIADAADCFLTAVPQDLPEQPLSGRSLIVQQPQGERFEECLKQVVADLDWDVLKRRMRSLGLLDSELYRSLDEEWRRQAAAAAAAAASEAASEAAAEAAAEAAEAAEADEDPESEEPEEEWAVVLSRPVPQDCRPPPAGFASDADVAEAKFLSNESARVLLRPLKDFTSIVRFEEQHPRSVFAQEGQSTRPRKYYYEPHVSAWLQQRLALAPPPQVPQPPRQQAPQRPDLDSFIEVLVPEDCVNERGEAWVSFQVCEHRLDKKHFKAIDVNDLTWIDTFRVTEEGTRWRRMEASPSEDNIALFARLAMRKLAAADESRLRTLGCVSPYEPEAVAQRIFSSELLADAQRLLSSNPAGHFCTCCSGRKIGSAPPCKKPCPGGRQPPPARPPAPRPVPQPVPQPAPQPASELGQCERNPWCVRGFKHGGRGGHCSWGAQPQPQPAPQPKTQPQPPPQPQNSPYGLRKRPSWSRGYAEFEDEDDGRGGRGGGGGGRGGGRGNGGAGEATSNHKSA